MRPYVLAVLDNNISSEEESSREESIEVDSAKKIRMSEA